MVVNGEFGIDRGVVIVSTSYDVWCNAKIYIFMPAGTGAVAYSVVGEGERGNWRKL